MPAMPTRSFQRRVSSLPEMFRFLDAALAGLPAGAEVVGDLRLAVDELFTNMVRHQPEGGEQVELSVDHQGTRILLRLVDHGVERFDPTAAPDPDFDVPAGDRREGGLGIYLTRQLMGAVRYEYDERLRRSTITLEKALEESDVQSDVGRKRNDSDVGNH